MELPVTVTTLTTPLTTTHCETCRSPGLGVVEGIVWVVWFGFEFTERTCKKHEQKDMSQISRNSCD